jgi:hypothetical protein
MDMLLALLGIHVPSTRVLLSSLHTYMPRFVERTISLVSSHRPDGVDQTLAWAEISRSRVDLHQRKRLRRFDGTLEPIC